MDGSQFDALSRSVATAGTRRGIVQLLGALPLLGVLLAVFDDEQAGAKRRQKSRRRRDDERKDVQADHHNRGQKHNNKNNKSKKSKKNDKHKKNKHHCKPQSTAQTCTGKCAQVTHNCGTVVDCGPCDCGACDACQICDATSGRCRANPEFLGQDCGSAGQLCQAVGSCACGDSSCPSGQRCIGGHCICDGTSCPTGCCDEAEVCHVDDADACGADGGACTPCANSGQACEEGTCCASSGSTAAVDVPCCAGLTQCANGVCQADCCVGVTCSAGECQNPGVCDPQTGVCSAPIQKAPGAPCDDGDACTSGATCTNGVCGGGSSICTNPGECWTTADATCNAGSCTYPASSAGTSCSSVACGRCDGSGECVGCPTDYVWEQWDMLRPGRRELHRGRRLLPLRRRQLRRALLAGPMRRVGRAITTSAPRSPIAPPAICVRMTFQAQGHGSACGAVGQGPSYPRRRLRRLRAVDCSVAKTGQVGTLVSRPPRPTAVPALRQRRGLPSRDNHLPNGRSPVTS